MIHVSFDAPVRDPDWKRWRTRASKATTALIAKLETGEAYSIREGLYKQMRQVFLDAFNGKCAYCEAKIILDQHKGDVEHFRPKGCVTDDRGKPVMIPAGGDAPAKQHPGYPWLAYDSENLLPSCAACNRPGRTREGRLVGKWDRFPVVRFRATSPGEEIRERPLLVNPCRDEPSVDLGLDTLTGVIYGKTPRGEATVEILDLNREGLPEERRKVYLNVTALARLARKSGNSDLLPEWVEQLGGYRRGVHAYSWAGRLALEDEGERIRAAGLANGER
jgi:hypothetical protein